MFFLDSREYRVRGFGLDGGVVAHDLFVVAFQHRAHLTTGQACDSHVLRCMKGLILSRKIESYAEGHAHHSFFGDKHPGFRMLFVRAKVLALNTSHHTHK